MRLSPSVPLPLERCVPSSGATICGRFLPSGTNVGMCASMIHQDTTIYGDDATSFRPERWLDAVPDARRAMERHFFAVSPIPFCQNKKIRTVDNILGSAL